MYFIYYYLAKWIWQLPPLAKVAVSNFDRYYEMKEMNILAYGYFVLLAVCSANCSAKFGFFCQAEHMNG